jgi:hypothetical protein
MNASAPKKRVPFDVRHVSKVHGSYPATCTVHPPLSGPVDPVFLTYLQQSIALVDAPIWLVKSDSAGIRFTTTEDHIGGYLEFTDKLIERANQVFAEHQGESQQKADAEEEILTRLKELTGK